MATYLIDFENVKSDGIRGIAQLGEEDTVVIFYSHNADTITFEAMDMIFSSKANVRKYKIICGGKNALDFQLVTYLGYLIHEAKDSFFYIISKDNGFRHVVDFWKRTFGYDGYVYCFPTIAEGNARQVRFRNASEKERQRVINEELAKMQEALQEEESEELEAKAQEEELIGGGDAQVKAVEPGKDECQQDERQRAVLEALSATDRSAGENEIAQVKPIPVEKADEFQTDKREDLFESAADDTEAGIALAENEETKEIVLEETVSEKAAFKKAESEKEAAKENLFKSASENALTDAFTISSDMDNAMEGHVSVLPPAELPESVRRELEKADMQFGHDVHGDEHLIEKIAAQVSDVKITVKDNSLTVHNVEGNAAEEKKADKKEENNKDEVKKQTSRGRRKNPPKKDKPSEALKDEAASDLTEKQEPEKKMPERKKTDKAGSQEKNEKAQRKPARRKSTAHATSKAEDENTEVSAQEQPMEEEKPAKKTSRRGRRPKNTVKTEEERMI